MPNFDVTQKIVDLKKAAIDAFMYTCESSFPTYRHWVPVGNYYEVSLVGLTKTNWKVTVPDFGGEGGGELKEPSFLWSLVDPGSDMIKPTRDFVSEFNRIRERIETALSPWYPDFPKEEPITDASNEGWRVSDLIRTEAYALPMSVGDTSVNRSANTDLAGDLNNVNKSLGAMHGTLIDKMEEFFGKLESTIGNIAALETFWNSSLCVESEIFHTVRNSVIDALDQAIYACQQIAKGGSGISFKVALNLLSAVMGLITSSSSASAAGAAASLTSAYISLKESDDVKITDSEGEKEVSTANDVLSHFESVLSKINEKMKNAEDSVSRQLENEWNDIHDNKQSNYIIELTPIDNICQEVIVNRHDVDNITNVYLPNISSILDKAALKAGDLSMSTVVYRAGDAGKYYRGPNGWYENMQQLIRSLLRNLAWQTSEAAYNLHAAADLYDDTDADASNRLKRTTENINNGSGVDFWRRPN